MKVNHRSDPKGPQPVRRVNSLRARTAAVALMVALSPLPLLMSAASVSAQVQRVPFLPQQTLRDHSISVRAVRYETADPARPVVIIYAAVRRAVPRPTLLLASTFDGTGLSDGSNVYSSAGYTFPSGMNAGEEGTFAPRTLESSEGVIVAFRYQLRSLPRTPMTWTVRERAALALPGQGVSPPVSFSIPVAEAHLPNLPTPPRAPLDQAGGQMIAGDGTFQTLGRLRARVDGVVYGGPRPVQRPGTGLVSVALTLQNAAAGPLTISSASFSGAIPDEGGRRTPHTLASLARDGVRVDAGSPITLAPGEWASLHQTYLVEDGAAERAARLLELTLFGPGERKEVRLDLPRSTAPAPTPPPPAPSPPPPAPPPAPAYAPPAEPVPNFSAQDALRGLAGEYVLNGTGSLRLWLANGLLAGEARTDQPVPDDVRLTLTPDGRLTGVMQRRAMPPQETWYTLDLTVSFDRSRLEGAAAFVHLPSRSPVPFSARRQPQPDVLPLETPAKTAEQPQSPPWRGLQGGSETAAGPGGFVPTAFFDMKVERVRRTEDGSVAVTLIVRNGAQERRGSPYDPQTFSLVGSDGMDYRTDGNHYGQSADDRPGVTNWIQPGAQGRVTYVFPGVPAEVTPDRLVLRENGAQTATFSLPQ